MLWHSTCDMPQHLPYCSRPMSYYYFRPYQFAHVAVHQDFVRSYGGNPRDPYENSIFERVYAETGAAEDVQPMEDEIMMPMPLEAPDAR